MVSRPRPKTVPIDEGYAVTDTILRMKRLDTPRRLPRPISEEQVRRLERCIQSAVMDVQMDRQLLLAAEIWSAYIVVALRDAH